MALQATGLMVEDDAGVGAFLADVLRLQGSQACPVGTVQEAEATRQRFGTGALTWSSPTCL